MPTQYWPGETNFVETCAGESCAEFLQALCDHLYFHDAGLM